MKKDLILFYSHKSEPVTAALLNQTKIHLYPISLDDFLNNSEIFDEISDERVTIQWRFPDGKLISNDSNTAMINRVLGCNSELFLNFAKRDRNYAQSELWGYLFFALNSFPMITSYPNSYTLCGGGEPLPRQWEEVKTIGIKVPEYYLGSMKYLPSDWDKKEIVCSSIQNLYFWQANYKANAGFAFKKPKGTPYLVFIRNSKASTQAIGLISTKGSAEPGKARLKRSGLNEGGMAIAMADEEDRSGAAVAGRTLDEVKPIASIHTMDNSSLNLQEGVQKAMISMALQVNQIFKYPLAELLIFLDGDQLAFGMIHHIPYGMSLTNDFRDQVLDWAETIRLGNL
jgi:hypothetical protein